MIEAQELLAAQSFAALSTLSQDLENYPFGSLVPYCLNHSGEPLLLISDIAQHTKNILKNSHVSLMAFAQNNPDIQANARLSYLGDAEKTQEPGDYERYYRYFPDAKDYHKTHNFQLFRVRCERSRYIGGFGKIFWVHAKDLVKPNPFSPQEELGILQHMNADHREALAQYCLRYKKIITTIEQVQMTGIDATAMDLLVGKYQKVRIPFPSPISNSAEARKTLVAMLR